MDVVVSFAPSGRRARVPAGTPLIEAVRRAGLPIASGCGAEGLCGRCGVLVLAGGDSLPGETQTETRAKRRNRVDSALRLACRVALRADVAVTAPYW